MMMMVMMMVYWCIRLAHVLARAVLGHFVVVYWQGFFLAFFASTWFVGNKGFLEHKV